MTITISAFAWVPPFAQGYVKDIRARWALEEAGLSYQEHLLRGDEDSAAYRAWQPFGQVPAYRDGEVELFESGAILLHIARKSSALAAQTPQEEAQVTAWAFAALNSIEPKVDNVVLPGVFYPDESWVEGFRPAAEGLLDKRLTSLANWMEGRDWLTARFSVADILMATVLRSVDDHPLFVRHRHLAAYLDRCLARPAFDRALNAQLRTFEKNAPADA